MNNIKLSAIIKKVNQSQDGFNFYITRNSYIPKFRVKSLFYPMDKYKLTTYKTSTSIRDYDEKIIDKKTLYDILFCLTLLVFFQFSGL